MDLDKERLGYGNTEIEERRFNYVDSKAMQLITSAGLEGRASESLREAVHVNYRPIVDQFRINEQPTTPADSTE